MKEIEISEKVYNEILNSKIVHFKVNMEAIMEL